MRIRDNPASPSHSTTAGSCGVWWPGLHSGGAGGIQWWDPVDHESQDAKIEIKDGAICLITTDSNNDGSINLADRDPSVKNVAPGKVIRANFDDDNKNGVRDWDEQNVTGENDLAKFVYYVWLDEPGANVYDIRLSDPEWPQIWADPSKANKFKNEQFIPSSGRIVGRLDSSHKTVTDSFWLEGGGWEETSAVTIKADNIDNDKSGSPWEASDSATYSVVDFGFQPYTPETKYIAPMPIPEQKWKENGVGIRRNNDYDDGKQFPDSRYGTATEAENDLIRLDLKANPVAGIDIRLRTTSGDSPETRLWMGPLKGGTPVSTVGGTTVAGSLTFYAEYVGSESEETIFVLEVVHLAADRVLHSEEIVFRPFESVTCAFVGERQTAGNPTVSPGVNDWVIQELLDGYDVHVWDDGHDVFSWGQDCNAQGNGFAFDEVVNAVNNRGINKVAILGYSHGGGSTYNLSRRIVNDALGYYFIEEVDTNGNTIVSRNENGDPIGYHFTSRLNSIPTIVFTSYIDAIRNDTWGDDRAEKRRPQGTQYHVNQFQKNTMYSIGFGLNGEHSTPRGAVDENRSHWIDKIGNLLEHDTIDDNSAVLSVLTSQFKQRVVR